MRHAGILLRRTQDSDSEATFRTGKPGPLSAAEVLSVGAVVRTPLRHSLFIFNVNHNKEVFFCQADPDRL